MPSSALFFLLIHPCTKTLFTHGLHPIQPSFSSGAEELMVFSAEMWNQPRLSMSPRIRLAHFATVW